MRIRIRIRIWIRNPGGGIYNSLFPPLSLSFFFSLYPSLLLSALPFYFLPSPLYLPLFLLLTFSLSLFLSKIIATFLRPFLLTFLLFLYIPFFMIQIVTKQMLAITTWSPPLSPPSSSPYLLLISFLSNITDYHCSNGGMDLPPPPHNEWRGGGEKGLVSLSPT